MAQMTDKQRSAIMHGKGNILVSASAGSGKTHTMIERVKRLVLEEDVGIDKILAVTFTEAAATDMKEKLKKALSNKQGADAQKLLHQLSLIPTADISTLHAFCARLIRTYFFVVGLSPDFTILDQSDATTMRAESLDKAFKEFYDGGEEWFYNLVDCHASGRTDANLKELVLQAYAFCDSEEQPLSLANNYISVYDEKNFSFLTSEYKNFFIRKLNFILSDADELYKDLDAQGLVKGAKFISDLISDMQKMKEIESIYALKEYENYTLRLDFDRKLTAEQVELKALASDCRDRLKKLIKRFCKNLTDEQNDFFIMQSVKEHTANFVKILERFSLIYAEDKQEENVLDFNDLEHFALKILSDEQILKDVKDKYSYIFVDEYQDVNGVQERIITKLQSDNLFMVGDEKQSIYGFRGCRPEFFRKKFEKMSLDGQAVLTLNHNFRSAKAVIDMVNEVFCYSMTKEHFGVDYRATAQLVSGGVYPEDKNGRATFHFLEKEESEEKGEESPRVYDLLQEIDKDKEVKDNHLVSLLVTIINQELGKTYYNPKEKRDVKIGYGDIAVLTRNKNNTFVSQIARGLISHGVPVTSDVKENICDFSEISILVNALRAVDCLSQDIPLATTLKSPIGGFSEEDLAQIVCYYKDQTAQDKNYAWHFSDAFDYYVKNAKSPLQERLKTFLEYFEVLRTLSDFIGAEGVLTKLVEDFHLDAFISAERGGKNKLARMYRLIDASNVGGKKLTVREFLQKIETSPEAFNFSEFGQEDTVKIMTIHASKGLEFPVVIVCGLERNMNGEEEREEILHSRDYGFAFKYYDYKERTKSETLLRGLIKENMQFERIREELRLFYVALTRATYSLHLTVEGKKDVRRSRFIGADKFIDYVPSSIPTVLHTPDEFEFTELKKGVRKIIISQADQNLTEQFRKNFAFIYPNKADTTLPLKLGVTTVADKGEEQLVHVLFDEPSPDTERGITAHAIMERLDFTFKKSFCEQVDDMIKSGWITEQKVAGLNLERIEKAVKNPALDFIKNCALYREKPFLAAVEASSIMDTDSKSPIVLQGIIDLLAIDGQNAYVIDYKYSSLDKNSLAVKYKAQLDIYANAAENVLGKKVISKTLINLFTGDVVCV